MSNTKAALGRACRLEPKVGRADRRLVMRDRAMAIARATGIMVAVLGLVSAPSAAETVDRRIGQRVENFSLPDFHGQSHALDDYRDRIVVLAFLGTECPLAKLYVLRLNELAAEFSSQGVSFVGIDSNLQDSLTEIGAFARSHHVSFPFLKDNNNELADRLGAVRTPEVFLLDRERIVRYRGRIDDQYGFKTGAGYLKSKLDERSLADAIRQVLLGKTVTHPVREAQGCLIGRRGQGRSAWGSHVCESDSADHATAVRRMSSRGTVGALQPGYIRRSRRLGCDDPGSGRRRPHAPLVC